MKLGYFDYLERHQVSVLPPAYRLFDHVLAALSLEIEGAEDEVGVSARVRLLLGTVSQPAIMQALTEPFFLDAVPGIERARIGWQRLQMSGKASWNFGHLLFLHLEHNTSGLSLEFPFVNGSIMTFRVKLGDLSVSGQLPETFSLSEYFGDAVKLED